MIDRRGVKLGDRPVRLVRRGALAGTGRARWWRGADRTFRVELSGPFGERSAMAPDLYGALAAVRAPLERDGWAVAVHGARGDVYPSPEARRTGGAVRLAPFSVERRDRPTLSLFDDVDPSQLATVSEQEANWAVYVSSPRGRVRRVKGERELVLARGDERHPGTVRWWQTDDFFAGVDLSGPFGTEHAIELDAFEALLTIRRRIEPAGWRVAVQGARRDTYPSGMQRDQGGGQRIYVNFMGRKATETVATFDPADPDQVVTVEEQQAEWRRWLGSFRGVERL
jgi:hypothetical protein